MATIINSPGNGTDTGGAGWMVAIVAIVLLILGGFWIWNMQQPEAGTPAPAAGGGTPPPANNFSTTINSTTTINNSTTTEGE